MELQDYIAQAQGLGMFELLRQRLVKQVPIATPAAGSQFSIPVPAGVTWELVLLHYRFTTSAVVVNRFPTLTILDADGIEQGRLGPSNTVTASSAQVHTLIPGYGTIISGGSTMAPAPDPQLLLFPGWSLTMTTSGMDVGDQYAQILANVREWSVAGVQAAAEYLCKQIR